MACQPFLNWQSSSDLYFVYPKESRSFVILSTHRIFCLPWHLRLPFGMFLYARTGSRVLSIRDMCPNQQSLFLIILVVGGLCLASLLISSFHLNCQHCIFMILLRQRVSKLSSFRSSAFLGAQVSDPYKRVGITISLYTLILVSRLMFQLYHRTLLKLAKMAAAYLILCLISFSVPVLLSKLRAG